MLFCDRFSVNIVSVIVVAHGFSFFSFSFFEGSEVCDEKDLPYDKVGVASTFRPDGHRDELHLTCKYGYKLRAGAPYTCNISRFTGKTFWAGSQACLGMHTGWEV